MASTQNNNARDTARIVGDLLMQAAVLVEDADLPRGARVDLERSLDDAHEVAMMVMHVAGDNGYREFQEI